MLEYLTLANDVNNLTDARYFAAWNVDWISFNLERHQGNKLDDLKAILEWINGPKIALKMDSWDPDLMFQAKDQVGIDAFHIRAKVIEDIRLFPLIVEVNDIMDVQNLTHAQVQCVLLDAVKPEKLHLDLIKSRPDTSFYFKYFEQFDRNILAQFENIGVAVAGGEEERPGYKSFDELDDFFESIYQEIE